MQSWIVCTTLVALSLTFPAQAQAQETSLASCQARLASVLAAFAAVEPPSVKAHPDGTCEYARLRYRMNEWQLLIADKLTIRTIGENISASLPVPDRLDATVTNLLFLNEVKDNPAFTYIIEQTAARYTLDLHYGLDRQTRFLQIEKLDLSTGRSQFLVDQLSAQLPVDTPDLTSAVRSGKVGLKTAAFSLNDPDGRFQEISAYLVGTALLQDAANPEQKVKELRAEADMKLRALLPAMNVDQQSIGAIVAAVTTYPRAHQRLEAKVELPKPVGLFELAGIAEGQLSPSALFPPGAIKVSYGQ